MFFGDGRKTWQQRREFGPPETDTLPGKGGRLVERARIPEWVKAWGPVVVILGAMWTLNNRLEDQLGARMDRLEDKIDQNTAAIVENGKAVARLEVRVARVEDDVTWLRNNHRGDR